MEDFRTDFQREREQRDLAIYTDYEEMMSVPGRSATVVGRQLMEKYNIHSLGTIYVIRKRVEKKLKEANS